MERIQAILFDEAYNQALQRIDELEKTRIYCGHGIDHALDVARIAYILVLEGRLEYTKPIVYAAGLLHDIGRFRQYEEGIPHHIASVDLARGILCRAGFGKMNQQIILDAIYHHRELTDLNRNSLNYILYKADKLSRACHHCQAGASCDWPAEMKNSTLTY